MNTKLKAVVVGAGWSAEGHTKAFQHYGVEVLAICARKPDIVQKVADGLGVPDASTDWRKSLLEHKPDIVAVTTPAILRTEVIEVAVELGCHIICEKPLALSAEDAGHIRNLIKDTNLKHAFAATHCYDPSVAYVQELLTQQKVIGDITAVDVGYTRRISGPPSDKIKPWNWMSSLAHGGGALNNGLTHRLGMLERMTGMKVSAAVGEAKIHPRKAPVVPEIRDWRVWRSTMITHEEASKLEWRECDAEWDYSAFFKLGYPNPDSGNSILVTMRTNPGVPSHKPHGGWFFYGTQGTLVGRGGHILYQITKHVGEETEELSVPQELQDDLPQIGDEIQNKWTALVRDFLADIQDQPHEPYLTFHDGWRYQIAIDAIRASKGWATMLD
ncbi:Gfo/Idh/MocA family oxidoreductase [Candidatus Poribacteria bacterium]|nr:Gfo/Idh/MocA family oxidoreductase [Candidatus Poribacteria bacterium]